MNYCPRCGFEAEELSDRDIEEGEVCEACLIELGGEGNTAIEV